MLVLKGSDIVIVRIIRVSKPCLLSGTLKDNSVLERGWLSRPQVPAIEISPEEF
jgi:hypothetical protein